jgi:hypothetical protein
MSSATSEKLVNTNNKNNKMIGISTQPKWMLLFCAVLLLSIDGGFSFAFVEDTPMNGVGSVDKVKGGGISFAKRKRR